MTEIREPNSTGSEVLYSTLPDERITLDDLRQLVSYLVAARAIMIRKRIGLDFVKNYFSTDTSEQFSIKKGVEPRLLLKFFTVSDHLSGDTERRRRVEAHGDFILSYTQDKLEHGDVCVYDNPSIAEDIRQFREFIKGGEAMAAAYETVYLSHAPEVMAHSPGIIMHEQGKAARTRRRIKWAQRMESKVDAITPESPRAAATEISHVSSGDISPESQARLYDMMQHYTPDSEHQTYAVRQMLGAAASINMELDALRRQGSTRAVVAQRKQELMHVWDQRLTSLSSEVRAASRASEEGLLSVGGATWSIGDEVPSQNTEDLR